MRKQLHLSRPISARRLERERCCSLGVLHNEERYYRGMRLEVHATHQGPGRVMVVVWAMDTPTVLQEG